MLIPTLFSSIRDLIKHIYNDFQLTNPDFISNYFFAEQLFGESKMVVFTDNTNKNYSFNFADNLGNYFYIRSMDGFINYNINEQQWTSCSNNYQINGNFRLVFVFESFFSVFLMEKKLRKALGSFDGVQLNKFTYNRTLISIEETGTASNIQSNINIVAFDFQLKLDDDLYNDSFNIITSNEEIVKDCSITICQNCTSQIGRYLDKFNGSIFDSSEF